MITLLANERYNKILNILDLEGSVKSSKLLKTLEVSLETIRRDLENLEKQGYEVETRNVFKGAYRCYIKMPKILFDNKISNLPEEKIMIQIDTAPHNFNYKSDKKILNKFGSSGIQRIINYAVFDVLKQIVVYPVYDLNTFSDKDGNVLPDAHLIKNG